MKTSIMLFALSIASVGTAFAANNHSVDGYVKKDGTYVAPHNATNPNDTKVDNYSSKGNVNPYTGKVGTEDPYAVKPVKPLR